MCSIIMNFSDIINFVYFFFNIVYSVTSFSYFAVF